MKQFIQNLLTLSIVLIGLYGQAQIKTYGNTQPELRDTNVFLDASELTDIADHKGKGFLLPEANLTEWEFMPDDVKFPEYFNGLIVHNTVSGKTKLGQGVQVNVRPGFYFFYNPDGATNSSVTSGYWIALENLQKGGGAPSHDGNQGDVYVDMDTGELYAFNGTAWMKADDSDNQDLSTSFNATTGKLSLGLTGDSNANNNAEIDLSGLKDGDAWGVTGEDKTSAIGRTGNVGIGINSPSEKLDVNGTSLFRNGKQATVYTGDQIQFGYNGTNQYKNAIRSRHHGGEDTYNAIDFYTWDAGVDGKSDSPTLHGMTVAGGRVGVGVTVPTKELDVDGELKVRTLAAGGAAGDQVVVADADGVLKKVAASSTFLGSDDQKLSVGAGAADTAVIALENGDDVTLKAASNIAISETGSTINVEVDEADLADIPATALTPGNNNEVLTTNAAGTIEWQAQSAINDGDAWGVTGEDKTTNVGRTGSVGIGTDTPISTLTVNSNLAHDGNFNYSTAAVSIFDNNHNGGNTPNGTRDILHLAREGVGGGAYGNKASFALGRFENSSSSSRSQLDIKLTDASFNQHNTVMSLRSNGNVGVGTTKPDTNLEVSTAGDTKLRITAGAEDKDAILEFNTSIGQNPAGSGYTIKNAIVSEGLRSWKRADMRFVLNNEANDNDYNIANDTRMIIKPSGNVGIGTDAPTQKLDVAGSARIRTLTTGTTGDQVVVADADGVLKKVAVSTLNKDEQKLGVGAGGTKSAEITLQNGEKVTLAASGSVDITENTGAKTITIAANDTTTGDAWGVTGENQNSAVSRTGAVGIGTTASGANKLQVKGGNIKWENGDHSIEHSTPGGQTGLVFNSGNAGDRSRFDIMNESNATATNRVFTMGYNNEKTLAVRKGGKVGVGITTPENKLDISSVSRSGTHSKDRPLYVTGDIGDDDSGIEFKHTNGTQGLGFGYNSIYAAGSNADQNLNLIPKGTNGKVGIGTTTPSRKLDVSGSFQNTGKGLFTVMDGADGNMTGASKRGIFMWNDTDTNWGIYMAQPGLGKALDGGTATTGAGFTKHAIRFRVNDNADQGFIFENANDKRLFSIRGSDGYAWFQGNLRAAVDYGSLNSDKIVVIGGDGIFKKVNVSTLKNAIDTNTDTDDQQVTKFQMDDNGLVLNLENGGGDKRITKASLKNAVNTDNQDLTVNFNPTSNRLSFGLTGDPNSANNNAVIDLSSLSGGAADGDAWGVTGEEQSAAISRTGNVGIGVSTPSEKLHVEGKFVVGSNNINEQWLMGDIVGRDGTAVDRDGNVVNINSYWVGLRNNTLTQRNEYALAQSYLGATVLNGSYLRFSIKDEEKMGVDANGNLRITGKLGVNVHSPNANLTESLEVDGNIKATGTITPDYVFQKYYDGESELKDDYRMLSLEEIESYTRQYKHLPGVPSAAEVSRKGGILVNRATEINLEKIEELYLHTIEQQKQLDKKDKEIAKLKARLAKIEAALSLNNSK